MEAVVFWERAVGLGNGLSVWPANRRPPRKGHSCPPSTYYNVQGEGWRFFTFGRDAPREKVIDMSFVVKMMNVFILVINQ